MNAATLDRRITAIHEAAHAVFALRFGIRIHHLAICRSGPFAGYVQMLSAPLVSQLDDFERQPAGITWHLLLRDTDHRAMTCLAGPLAEAKLLGRPMRSHTCESDLSKCAQVCFALEKVHRRLTDTQRITLPIEAPVDMANRLRRRAFRVLAHPGVWRAVTALADELQGWSQLTGHDAADTVQWTRRVRNQLALILPIPEIQALPARPLRRWSRCLWAANYQLPGRDASGNFSGLRIDSIARSMSRSGQRRWCGDGNSTRVSWAMDASRNHGNLSKDTNNSSPPMSSQQPCGETFETSTDEVPVPSGTDFIDVFLDPGQC